MTPREREVLELMVEGRSNRGICEKLFLSPKTVESHVNNIFTSSASRLRGTTTAACSPSLRTSVERNRS